MTTFLIIAAALAVAASLLVALPLLKSPARLGRVGTGSELNVSVYREQLGELDEDRRAGRLAADQYEQARGEIERRLVEEVPDVGMHAGVPARRHFPVAAVVAGVVVPLLAGLLYLALGNPIALGPQTGRDKVSPHQLEASIAQLAARLEKNPLDGKGWVMLARSQAVLGRFAEASSAYARSVALFPENAQLLADYADTLAMAQGHRLQGEPEALLERALRADPDNAKALVLAGTVAFGKKHFATAVNHWQRLVGMIPAGSELARSIQARIAEAKRLTAGGVRQPADGPGATETPARR